MPYKDHEKHLAHCKAYNKVYRERFRDRCNAERKAWREENREHIAAYMREYRRKPNDRPKQRARLEVAKAVRMGKLTRRPCEICGTMNELHAHHDDYSQPLEVRWLCEPHHKALHQRIRQDNAIWSAVI